MARGTRKAIKAVWDRLTDAIRGEHNTVVDEVDELRTKFDTLTAKLDADTGTTDNDYASTLALSATEAKKVERQ